MAHSDFLIQNAKTLGIDINEPSGQGKLLVYKRMLEGMWVLLRTNKAKALGSTKTLGKDLQEICNDFDDMRGTDEAKRFIKSKYVKSIDGILNNVREASHYLYAASQMNKGANTAEAHVAVSQSLTKCQDALRKAINVFSLS